MDETDSNVYDLFTGRRREHPTLSAAAHCLAYLRTCRTEGTTADPAVVAGYAAAGVDVAWLMHRAAT